MGLKHMHKTLYISVIVLLLISCSSSNNDTKIDPKIYLEQQRLDIEKKPESEVTPNLEAVAIELAAGIYSTLNTKINSLNKDILFLKNQYELVAENNLNQ